jgi:hypothetical protein
MTRLAILPFLLTACGSPKQTETPKPATVERCNTAEACVAPCGKGSAAACLRLAEIVERTVESKEDAKGYLVTLWAACEGTSPVVCGPLAHLDTCDETMDEEACEAAKDKLLRRACEDPTGWEWCEDLTLQRFDEEMEARAREMANESCAAGDARACLFGIESPVDEPDSSPVKRAKKLLSEACDAGDVLACHDLYMEVSFDEAEEQVWITKACALNPDLNGCGDVEK